MNTLSLVVDSDDDYFIGVLHVNQEIKPYYAGFITCRNNEWHPTSHNSYFTTEDEAIRQAFNFSDTYQKQRKEHEDRKIKPTRSISERLNDLNLFIPEK